VAARKHLGVDAIIAAVPLGHGVRVGEAVELARGHRLHRPGESGSSARREPCEQKKQIPGFWFVTFVTDHEDSSHDPWDPWAAYGVLEDLDHDCAWAFDDACFRSA
jgi:hypothetical protein